MRQLISGQSPIELCDLGTLMRQLRYSITLFLSKMTGHRWDSVSQRVNVLNNTGIGNAQQRFYLPHFWALLLHFRFETTTFLFSRC
jgi:hypothetical protein